MAGLCGTVGCMSFCVFSRLPHVYYVCLDKAHVLLSACVLMRMATIHLGFFVCSVIGSVTVPVASLQTSFEAKWHTLVSVRGATVGTIFLALWQRQTGRRHLVDASGEQKSAVHLSRAVFRSSAMRQALSRVSTGRSKKHAAGAGAAEHVSPPSDAASLLPPTTSMSVPEVSLDGSGSLASKPPTGHASQTGQAPQIVRVSDDCVVKDGGDVRLEVVATGVPPPEYQWFMDTEDYPATECTGETAAAFVVTDFERGLAGTYSCRVSNSVGTVVSRPIRVGWSSQGGTVLTAFASGPAPASPNLPLASAGVGTALGATATPSAAFLSAEAAPPSAAGHTTAGHRLSNASVLPVRILYTSEDCEVEVGGLLKLEVKATGVPPPAYQWFLDTAEYGVVQMEGETSPVLLIPDFFNDLVGMYTCHVSNSCGTIVCPPIRVTLKPRELR
jgi:hypothetical protein